MPTIPLMAYNVFVAMDDTYWTGYPTAEDPYANPVPNWGNSRYMMVAPEAASRIVDDAAGTASPSPSTGDRHARMRIAPMKTYAIYLAKRLLQFVLVVFIGINLTYVISHATPIDPVEQTISALTSFGNTSPEAIETMRQSLRELYGMTGTRWNSTCRSGAGSSSAISGRRCRPSRPRYRN